MENNKIKVLIIEDEKPYLRLLDAFLAEVSGRGRSYEVTGAETLSQALELLEAGRYDVIVSDLFLPDTVGLATLTPLSARAASPPVVRPTGRENEPVAEEAMRRGAQDYLSKKSLNGEELSRA